MMTLQKTPAQGAYCSVHVATSGALTGKSGDYYFHCDKWKVNSAANNEAACLRLWNVSEEYTRSSEDVADVPACLENVNEKKQKKKKNKKKKEQNAEGKKIK